MLYPILISIKFVINVYGRSSWISKYDIHSMIENAAQKMDDCGFTEEGEWTYLAKLFGSNAVPGESASVIQQAIKKAEKEGTITSKNRWQLIEYLCADYLSGR